MAPRLVARTGPLEGGEFPLDGPALTIGRDEGNSICLPDPKASRWHCAIETTDTRYTIRDLDSHNGTYVNDIRAYERPLADGDEIRIGESAFAFLVGAHPSIASGVEVNLDDGEEVGGTATTLRRGDAHYVSAENVLDTYLGVQSAARPETPLGPDEVAWSNQRADSVARIVRVLVGVCRIVSAGLTLEQLQGRLLESIFKVIPAGRGALFLGKSSEDASALAVHWEHPKGRARPFRIPRVVVESVLSSRASLCRNDVMKDTAAIKSQTILDARVAALLAAPIVRGEAVIGALYLDTSDPLIRFEDADLQLLTAIGEVAAPALGNALAIAELEREHERVMDAFNGDRSLVGSTEAMRAVRQFIGKVAPSDSTVLIVGESGTGKELVAHALHRQSPRARKPFVAISCAAIPEHLLESEFFGYEKGAFTGAVACHRGKLEQADGGTVFLDEIGELAAPLQAKLLRVLQEREFERVGGSKSIRVNIRVIAATHRNLEQDVCRGSFRQDLYYRLNVVAVTMPALRNRRADIPPLVHSLLRKHAERCARRVVGVSPEALSYLTAHDWPGNVRELENVIERAIVLGTTEYILPDDLPDSIIESC